MDELGLPPHAVHVFDCESCGQEQVLLVWRNVALSAGFAKEVVIPWPDAAPDGTLRKMATPGPWSVCQDCQEKAGDITVEKRGHYPSPPRRYDD
jgi:hypothetical protein